MKLPPGFRFHPTDEELVVQYLRRKVFSCPLPAAIIPEIDLAKYNPWDLPGKQARERAADRQKDREIRYWTWIFYERVTLIRWVRTREVLLRGARGQIPEREPVEPGDRMRVLEGDGQGPGGRGVQAQPSGRVQEDAGLLPS